MISVTKYYDLDIKSIEKISKGYASNKWLIVTNDEKKYVLKEEKNISSYRIEYIMYVMENLKEYTHEIIKTKDNKSYIMSDNNYYYLMEYIDEINEKDVDNIDFVYNLGDFLSKLHKSLQKLKSKKDSFLDFNDNYEKLIQYLKDAKNNNCFEYIKIIEYKLNILDELKATNIDLKNLDYQIVHGDMYIGNIIYNKDLKIIDFTQTCNFYKEYEVLRAMMMICFNEDKNLAYKKMSSFISAYFKYNKIKSPIDAYNLYLYVQANSLSSLKVSDYNNPMKKEFAIKRFNILTFLYEEKDRILEILKNKQLY